MEEAEGEAREDGDCYTLSGITCFRTCPCFETPMVSSPPSKLFRYSNEVFGERILPIQEIIQHAQRLSTSVFLVRRALLFENSVLQLSSGLQSKMRPMQGKAA